MALFFVGAGLWAISRGDIRMAMGFFTPGGLILIGVFRLVTGAPSGHMTLSVGVFLAMFILGFAAIFFFLMTGNGGAFAFRMTALFTCLSVLCAVMLLVLRTSKVTRYVVDLKMYSIEEADRQDLDG